MKQTSKIQSFLALLVFTVYALCVLAVLLTGAEVYRDLVHSGGESYQERTAAQYVATRVRQARTVTVEEFDGCQALTVSEEIGTETYITRVYCYDGYLRELYCAENAELSPEDGEKVMEAESLQFSLEEGLLTARIDSKTLVLHLRSGKEVGP